MVGVMCNIGLGAQLMAILQLFDAIHLLSVDLLHAVGGLGAHLVNPLFDHLIMEAMYKVGLAVRLSEVVLLQSKDLHTVGNPEAHVDPQLDAIQGILNPLIMEVVYKVGLGDRLKVMPDTIHLLPTIVDLLHAVGGLETQVVDTNIPKTKNA